MASSQVSTYPALITCILNYQSLEEWKAWEWGYRCYSATHSSLLLTEEPGLLVWTGVVRPRRESIPPPMGRCSRWDPTPALGISLGQTKNWMKKKRVKLLLFFFFCTCTRTHTYAHTHDSWVLTLCVHFSLPLVEKPIISESGAGMALYWGVTAEDIRFADKFQDTRWQTHSLTPPCSRHLTVCTTLQQVILPFWFPNSHWLNAICL